MTTTIPSSPIELMEHSRLNEARENGFALFAVLGDGNIPAYIYSIGMAQHGFPEILCFAGPGMGTQTLGLVHNVCTVLVESVRRFGRSETLRSFCHSAITARDPQITYQPQLLRGDTNLYALNAFVTRALRFRGELGIPSVIELRHEGVPDLERIRCMLMMRG